MIGGLAVRLPAVDAAEPKPGYCASKSVSAALLKDCRNFLKLKYCLDKDGVLNWGDNVKVRDWTGVKVNRDGTAVIRLNLHDKGLTGDIPPRLGRLSGLKRIDLGYKALTGPVPSTLALQSQITFYSFSRWLE